MKVSGRLKRMAVAVGTAGVLSTAVITASAGAASASTIPNGQVQLCSQGNYTVYMEFPNRGGLESTTVPQGQCWQHYMGGNSWEPIKVYGIWNSHPDQSFYIGIEWYDGAVSGIGIGAEGSTTNPYLWTW